MLSPSAVRACLAALLAALAPAQAPSPWADLTVPGGASIANISSLGKLVAYTAGSQVHVFSAFTRRWQTWNVSGPVTLRQANDWLLIQDGSTWVGFAAMRGVFAPLPVSAGATVLNPSNQNNDSILLVRDGNTLHAFSGLVGSWISRSISPTALYSTQRHVALIADGSLLSGMDAYTGQWHDLIVPQAATALSTDGSAGVATAPGVLYGFSANLASWSQSAPLPGAASVRNDDWMLWQDGLQVLAFSGLTGTFATTVVGPVLATTHDDMLCLLQTGLGVTAYSAITGSFASATASTTAGLRATVAAGLVLDGTTLLGYSAPRGTFAALSLDASADDLAGVVIAAAERTTGRPWLFSALTGQWHGAPADALPGLPLLATTCALLPTATGFRAFSARTGAFAALIAPGGVPALNSGSAGALVWDNTAIHVFDDRISSWRSTPRAGSGSVNAQLWRTSVLADDGGARLLGFGTQAGQVHLQVLPEPVQSLRANSECGYALTQNHVLAFGAVPEPTSLFQFPEFRRAFLAGGTFRLHLRLLQGDAAFLALGLRASPPASLPGLGQLLLDQTALAATFVLPDPGENRVRHALPVPALPALRGSEWWWQALVLPAGRAPYLTDAASVLVL